MKVVSRRWALMVAVLTVAWLTGVVFAMSQAGSTPQTSEQVFKNVQVLKGLPVDEFMGTMGVFTASLSLCCGDCHTGAGTSDPKWEDDPPRKKTARAMVQMVQGINRTNFGGRQVVTCWTCHRGQQRPATTAPLDYAYGEPVVVPPDILPRATSGGPTLDQVFDKYIQALGGAARVNALTAYAAKGRSILYGEVGDGDPAEIYAKAPNQLAMTTRQREGDVVRTFDGANAWWQLPLTVVPQYPLTGTMLEGARFDAAMAFPWRIRDFFTNWRVSYPATVDGTEVEVVQGNTSAGMIGTLYFDKQSGLLKRMIRYAGTAVGRIPTQIDYSDYRPVAGVMMPFKFSYCFVNLREEWTLSEYQPNVPVDASRFGKPVNRTGAR
ncbi:MAG TPA: photosynthetic reaction center cytochrome c subunit family protein [Vicinamibacterales bacterium]|nr:photosynthetic reaction center cytochrome c subunit family protein [Vicinamibacterales bacterium]